MIAQEGLHMNASKVRNLAPQWTVTALTIFFGLQMIRVFYATLVYYLRDSQRMSALNLAPIALGVFALSFLAAPLWRLAGIRTALAITAGGVALVRVVEQFVTSAGVDLILVSAGIVLMAMYVPVALGAERARGPKGIANFGYGLLLGLALDTAVFAAAGTVDLSWQASALPIVIIGLMGAVALFALARYLVQVDPGTAADRQWARALTLAALGPWLFLQLVIFQNVARMSAISGWSLQIASLYLVGVNVLALVAAAHAGRINRMRGFPVIIGLAYVIILLFPSSEGLVGALLSGIGQVLSASLIMIVLIGLGERTESTGRIAAVVANGIGQLLLVIFSFVYYVSYDIGIGIRAEMVLPVAGVLVALGAILGAPRKAKGEEPAPNIAPALAALVLLLLPVAMVLTWKTPQPVIPTGSERTVRVMSYNLHNGFNTDGRLDLEALAQVIEESGADIIGLQEVSRGWVINGSVDMLSWFSHRLKMPVVSGPTEGQLWGNAILSRLPIVDSESVPLPSESLLLRRGYTVAEIDMGRETVRLINTHLHHIGEDSEMRQQQVPGLIKAWNGEQRTVIMGDLNAEPESPEMQMLYDAGLVDISAVIGPTPRYTFDSTDPYQQIDYIWTSGDLGATDFVIPQSTASDHLGVVATLVLP
jgi:endonuclease/exonuclease/phosphatase family metal-dependent hydrolase